MEEINAKITNLKHEHKALEHDKAMMSTKIMRNYEKPPPFVDVVTAFEQDPVAALEKYGPIRDRFVQNDKDEKEASEIKARLHELHAEISRLERTKTDLKKQLAAEARIGEFEGLNENQLKSKAVGLLALFNRENRSYDPRYDDSDSDNDASTQTEAKLDAVVILLKRKNVEVTYHQGTISFSGESRGKSCKVARK